jgi:hypothetical protein
MIGFKQIEFFDHTPMFPWRSRRIQEPRSAAQPDQPKAAEGQVTVALVDHRLRRYCWMV